MRILIRVVLALAVLALLGLAALAVLLPRIAESEAVSRRLQQAARDAVGRDVHWDGLSVGLFPPRLVARGPRVAGERPDSPPQLEARNIDLRVAILPLFARAVVIDSLEIEGVSLRVVRTPDGVSLPAVPGPGKLEAGPSSGQPASGMGVSLAVRELRLTDSRLELEDRVVKPSVRWVLEGVDASAKGSSLQDPLQIQLTGELGSGGRIGLSGTATLEGRGDLRADLDAVALDALAPYLGMGRLGGRASGDVRVAGELASPEELAWDLSIADAQIEQEELSLRGAVVTRGQLSGGFERGTGSFSADATEAELRYGEAFHKPRGKRASLSGALVADPKAGITLDDLKMHLDSVEATGRLRTRPRMRLELEAPAIDVGAIAPLLPTLAEMKPAGNASISKLVVQTEPLELAGSARIDSLRLSVEGGGPVTLSGLFEAAGARIASRELTALIGEQTVPLNVTVDDLSGAPRYRVRANAEKADVDALVKALTGTGGTLTGALTSNMSVEGPLGGTQSALETLAGDCSLDIREGRMRGVSLLRHSMERLGALGDVALALGAAKGGKTLQRFYEDDFESITGNFRIAAGKARTDDLKLVYRHYTVDLKGLYGLLDSGLDFSGKLTIDPEVTAAMVEPAAGSTEPPAETPGRRRVIPLAHVGGTLTEPRVSITREAALALATELGTGQRRGELEQKIDERLGEGAGKEILGTLEGILGRRKQPEPPPQEETPKTP
jgi:hypothetical protein